MNFKITKLLGPRLIVRIKDEEQNQTEDGVFIPQAAVKDIQMYDEAIVVNRGTGKVVGGPAIEFSVDIGDKVMVSKYATKSEIGKVEVDGIKYIEYLMNDGEISAIIE